MFCKDGLFLKKIIAIIEEEQLETAMQSLAERLPQQGIVFQYHPLKNIDISAIRDKEIVEGTCLWLTDMEDMAGMLREEGQPVLAVLHERNRSSNFATVLYACEEPEALDWEYFERVYRRYKRIPLDILETDRCILRETTPDDAEAFYEIYKEPSITEYTEGLFPELEKEKQYINDYIDKVYSFYDFGIWTVLKKDTGEIIGRAGITYREGYEQSEIGFVIGKSWQRQGYAEEVCRAVLEYGRGELGFEEIQAFVRPQNKASLALCRKLGMQPAGDAVIANELHTCMKITYAS